MDSMWMLYWITRAITLKDVSGGLWAASICIGLISILVYVASFSERNSDGFRKLIGKVFAVNACFFIFAGVSYIMCPTKEEAAVIVAGGAVVEAAKSETAQRLAGKSVMILENSLDNILGKQAIEKAKNGTLPSK